MGTPMPKAPAVGRFAPNDVTTAQNRRGRNAGLYVVIVGVLSFLALRRRMSRSVRDRYD
jgi:hypothetical protein